MPKYKVTEGQLTSIANAVRQKTGSVAKLEFPDGFVDAISGLVPKIKTSSGINSTKFASAKTLNSRTVTVLYADVLLPATAAGPIKTYAFTPDFEGSGNIVVYPEYNAEKFRIMAVNVAQDSVTIPANTTLTITYDAFFASLA